MLFDTYFYRFDDIHDSTSGQKFHENGNVHDPRDDDEELLKGSKKRVEWGHLYAHPKSHDEVLIFVNNLNILMGKEEKVCFERIPVNIAGNQITVAMNLEINSGQCNH